MRKIARQPSARQQDKATFGFEQPDDLKGYPLGPYCPGRFLASISLIDIGQFNALVRRILNGGGTAPHLGAIIPIGWRDMQGQQVAQRIHSHMQLRAPFAFGPVVTGARPALGCRT